MTLQLRAADRSDADELTRIAFAAKRHWDYPEAWIQLWADELRVGADYIETNRVFVAERDGRILGWCSVTPDGAELDYCWVDPGSMGQGVGKALIEKSVSVASELKSSKLSVVADPNAASFTRNSGSAKSGNGLPPRKAEFSLSWNCICRKRNQHRQHERLSTLIRDYSHLRQLSERRHFGRRLKSRQTIAGADMGNYVDGFVVPIPLERLDEYRRLAAAAAEIWKEHGALEYREFIGDDLELEGTLSFQDLLTAAQGEAIVFGWISFESREARDLAGEKVAADPRLVELVESSNSGFDAGKMAFGGFRSML